VLASGLAAKFIPNERAGAAWLRCALAHGRRDFSGIASRGLHSSKSDFGTKLRPFFGLTVPRALRNS
jgi:hypothetical protein